jgi:hypothetical protein
MYYRLNPVVGNEFEARPAFQEKFRSVGGKSEGTKFERGDRLKGYAGRRLLGSSRD